MKRTDADGVIYFSVPLWDGLPGVVHGFFTRAGGVSPAPYASLNAGPKGGDGYAHVRENLRRIARAVSIPPETIFCASQVHGDQVRVVTACHPSIFDSEEPLQGDGLLTAEKGLYLGILTADCLPLLLLDPRRSVVAAVHAGWRSTREGIAEKAVCEMHRAFGCEPADLLVALGPAIGPCCYAVGDEVAQGFLVADRATEPFLHPAGSGRWKMNLEGVNRHRLSRAGIRDENVFRSAICTSCRKDQFFSARADGEPTGRQISLIGLRPGSNQWEPGLG
jgi:purine-nucleoside/S-methyl-5'-thioadenosine phosphorylase / adenosine deaminase